MVLILFNKINTYTISFQYFTGDKVKALALISEMVDEDEYREDESLNTKAVELIKEIINGSPSDDDISK
jgi:hypothetical protein